MSVATSILSPVSHRQGKVVEADVMYLDEIPVAMDRMGWRVSAALMRRWFSTKPAWAMHSNLRGSNAPDPRTLPASRFDDQIVKMDWVLSFARVRAVFEDLLMNWDSEGGKGILVERLIAAGWKSGKSIALGHDMAFARKLEKTCQVNMRSFGSYTDTLDDLSGPIFKANLKLAVTGQTSRSIVRRRDIFEVERVGFYVRDTYDFNSGWFEDATVGLGIWDRERCLSKAEMAVYKASPFPLRAIRFPGFVQATNLDFRRWQHGRNEGGDFYVFSDVLWVETPRKYVELP